ncbi:hypothetical protein HMSSN036_29700 [Paenibacillus macerans]|nr:hypothetical protein HMSSN036_29700 [Paenibacillus macerans]
MHAIVLHHVLAEPLLKDIKHIDVAVIGDFENTLSELCVLIAKKKSYTECKGVAYILNGNYVINNFKQTAEIGTIFFSI